MKIYKFKYITTKSRIIGRERDYKLGLFNITVRARTKNGWSSLDAFAVCFTRLSVLLKCRLSAIRCSDSHCLAVRPHVVPSNRPHSDRQPTAA